MRRPAPEGFAARALMTPTPFATWQDGAASGTADNAVFLDEGDQMEGWHADLPGTSPRDMPNSEHIEVSANTYGL